MNRLFKLIINEKGQSMVEFALVLPILVLLVMGIIQFGIIFSAQIALTNAAREGARAASVGTSEMNVKSRVINAIEGHSTLNLVVGNITVTYPADIGGEVRVVVTDAVINLIVPVPDVFVPGNVINIDAKASMRLEKKP